MPRARNSTTPDHWLPTLGVLFLAMLGDGCALRPGNVSAVPQALQVPDTDILSVAAKGAGFQVYECRAIKSDALKFAWSLKAPDAKLRYQAGKELGRHYAGPTWEANDGSKVVGEVIAQDNGPNPSAIPWLLLRATHAEGSGLFGRIDMIQRLHTAGGKAPTTGCTAGYAGTEARVAYSADYYFYAARP